jgi:hypothetical protein
MAIVIVFTLLYFASGGALDTSLSVMALLCLPTAAILLFRSAAPFGQAAVTCGLVGLWSLFHAVVEPLAVSSVALRVIAVAATRFPRLIRVRTAVTIWTVALALLSTYLSLLDLKGETGEATVHGLEVALVLTLLVSRCANCASRYVWPGLGR